MAGDGGAWMDLNKSSPSMQPWSSGSEGSPVVSPWYSAQNWVLGLLEASTAAADFRVLKPKSFSTPAPDRPRGELGASKVL